MSWKQNIRSTTGSHTDMKLTVKVGSREAVRERIFMVRNTDPITSKLAALSVNNKDVDLKIIAHLAEHGPKTSLELSDELGIAYVTISPRPIHLRRDGLIHHEGMRKNRTGRNACVWAIGGTPGGMPTVSTGPQQKLKFRRYDSLEELQRLYAPCGRADLPGFIAALNADIVKRLG
jgi:DNA-binding Lrp family transcriptional regulator